MRTGGPDEVGGDSAAGPDGRQSCVCVLCVPCSSSLQTFFSSLSGWDGWWFDDLLRAFLSLSFFSQVGWVSRCVTTLRMHLCITYGSMCVWSG